MRHLRGMCTALLVVPLASCGRDASVPPVAPPFATVTTAAFFPLDVFGIGAKVPGSHGCNAPEYRQFDFWVGKWDVFNPANALVGTNVVESELGGCAVEENWTSAFNGRGRSLNAFDASTGTWSQFWVSTGGCPFGTILIEGGLENGSMTMSGRREQPLGFLSGPPCAPPPTVVVFVRTDLVRWTALASGSVLQQFSSTNNDAPLPPLPPPSSGLGLRYDRVAQVTPLNPPSPSFCPTRVAAQQFNFMLGTWDVHQGEGEGAQGTATFTKDLAGCLVEERFTGPGGYAGWSFNTFDVFTQAWTRTYVDSDGQRLHMLGALVNGAMVLRGTKRGSAGRSVEVRITWDPVAVDRVVQTWDFSLDGGTTWKTEKEIIYTKRV